ncbi:MAG: hypothetical protein DRI89_14230, partial [Bacteroidetes bacterium]
MFKKNITNFIKQSPMESNLYSIFSVNKKENNNFLKSKTFKKLLASLAVLLFFGVGFQLDAQVTKQLYLSESDTLDRIDPVATGDGTTSTTVEINIDASPSVVEGTTTSNSGDNPGTTFSLTHISDAGDNRLLLVGISLQRDKADALVTGVTYGGSPMTSVGQVANGNKARIAIYQMVDPPVGSATVEATFSASPDKGVVMGATTFLGVDQATPLGTFAPATAKSTTPTVNVTSATGELVFDVVAVKDVAASADGLQDELWSTNPDKVGGGASTKSGSTSTTMSWTTGDKEWAIGGVSIKPYIPATSVSFTQAPVMCSDFTISSGGTITVTNYINVLSGSMPPSPNITATLKYGSTTIASLSSPSYAGSILTWSGTIASTVTVPAGDTIVLQISSAQTGVSFAIEYDSDTKPSKVEISTPTFITIDSYELYDAPYPNGTLITTAPIDAPSYVRIVTSDPFGAYDITSTDLDFTDPSAGTSSITLSSANVVSSIGCEKIYEYEWTPSEVGSWTIDATANEGFEDAVTATESMSPTVYSFVDAIDDFESYTLNTPLPIAVLDNDLGDVDATTVTVITPPNFGSTGVVAGVITYTPNTGSTNNDSFTYKVCSSTDGGVCDIATVYVNNCDAGAAENKVGGIVFLEVKPDDGIYNPGETLMNGITVDLYADTDCSGTIDAGEDTPVQTTTSGVDGRYSFTTTATGCYITKLDLSGTTDYIPSLLEYGTVNFTVLGTCDLYQNLGMMETIDLEVSKTVDDETPVVGDLITFTITVTNNGPDDATDVEVYDVLSPKLSFDSYTATGGTTYDENTGLWDVGSLANGTTETL